LMRLSHATSKFHCFHLHKNLVFRLACDRFPFPTLTRPTSTKKRMHFSHPPMTYYVLIIKMVKKQTKKPWSGIGCAGRRKARTGGDSDSEGEGGEALGFDLSSALDALTERAASTRAAAMNGTVEYLRG
jgi:hypothetical protein